MDKIMNWVEALEKRKTIKKLVFTNGCFDLLHPGHVRYLRAAKSLGSHLWVGLNSDSSVRSLKGETRPICPQDVRAEMLSALEVVDGVIIFNEETPYNLIKHIMPNVLVKGGDWAIKDIVGSDLVLNNGGEVKSLLLLAGFSSTNIIEKIKKGLICEK